MRVHQAPADAQRKQRAAAHPRQEVRQAAPQTLHLHDSSMTPTAARAIRPDQPTRPDGLHQFERLASALSSRCDLGGRLPVTRCRTIFPSAPAELARRAAG